MQVADIGPTALQRLATRLFARVHFHVAQLVVSEHCREAGAVNPDGAVDPHASYRRFPARNVAHIGHIDDFDMTLMHEAVAHVHRPDVRPLLRHPVDTRQR
ncbi:MAG: hypothetical protein M3069_26550 [Chloroflexota bacterium]|nr:hypothetical protein [Chloroflexota bacterium]